MNIPSTYNIPFRGFQPYVWKWSLGGFLETGSGYITIGYDPIKNIIMNNTQIKDSVDDITVYANINEKNYNITNKSIKINTNKKITIKTWLHKRDRHTNYQQNMTLKSIIIDPNSNTFSVNYINIPEYWGYVLHAWGEKPWDMFQKSLKLSDYYDFSKSKQMPCQEPYLADLPISLTDAQRKAIKEIFGYDTIHYHLEGTQIYCLGLFPKNNKFLTIQQLKTPNILKNNTITSQIPKTTQPAPQTTTTQSNNYLIFIGIIILIIILFMVK